MILVTFKILSDTIPVEILCMLFVLTIILIAQIGLTLFNKWRPHTKITTNNEVAGIMFGAISLIYSLILAFVIVAVWEDYEELEKTIHAEADKMNAIIAHTSTMPDSVRNPVHEALYAYCKNVIQREWQMSKNTSGVNASAIPQLREMLLSATPQNDLQKNVFAVIDNELSQITELRRNRLSHNTSQIPNLVWLILRSGTVLLIVFSYFFQIGSMKLKRIYISFFSGCLAMCLFLVSALDHPFDTRMQMSKEPFLSIQQELKSASNLVYK